MTLILMASSSVALRREYNKLMKAAYQTDIGHQRKQNQDRVAVFTNRLGNQLMVIADGVSLKKGLRRLRWKGSAGLLVKPN